MFSFSGLTADHVATLRKKHSIYVVGNGRINIAGMRSEWLPRIAAAILDVIS